MAIIMSYIYTLVVESQNPSSISASFLIRNAKKAVLWLIGGVLVAPHTSRPPIRDSPPIRVSPLFESVSYSSQSHSRVSLPFESASRSSQPPVRVSLPFESASYSSHLLNYTIGHTYSHLNQH
jgi:hypothetical protein